jgi:hypothetical protein
MAALCDERQNVAQIVGFSEVENCMSSMCSETMHVKHVAGILLPHNGSRLRLVT